MAPAGNHSSYCMMQMGKIDIQGLKDAAAAAA